jgi:hypothetical protein
MGHKVAALKERGPIAPVEREITFSLLTANRSNYPIYSNLGESVHTS